MPSVQDILSSKGAKVHTIAPNATVSEAVEKMNRNRIGALVVQDGEDTVGMFTERDVLQRVVSSALAPSDVKVGEVMTGEVICCRPDDDIDEVAAVMKNQRVRHVPVCFEGQLVGLISIGDVNAHHASAQQAQIHFLNEYIYGRA